MQQSEDLHLGFGWHFWDKPQFNKQLGSSGEQQGEWKSETFDLKTKASTILTRLTIPLLGVMFLLSLVRLKSNARFSISLEYFCLPNQPMHCHLVIVRPQHRLQMFFVGLGHTIKRPQFSKEKELHQHLGPHAADFDTRTRVPQHRIKCSK